MSQSIQAQIDHYLQQDLDALSLSEIRAELREKQFSEEDIREIVAEIDKHKLLGIQKVKRRKFELSRGRIGVFLIFVGVTITLTTFIFEIRGFGTWVLAYGPIISGVSLIWFAPKYRGDFLKIKKQSTIRERKKR